MENKANKDQPDKVFTLKADDSDTKEETNQSEDEGTTDDSESDKLSGLTGVSTGSDDTKKKEKSKKTFKDKLYSLEKELTLENINKWTFQSIFHVGSEPKKKLSEEKVPSDQGPVQIRLSSVMAAIFIVAAVTGSGILSLPFALKGSGWLGAFLALLFGLNALYSAMCIGWCWIIMQERWPEYKEDSRHPYPDIGARAVGTWIKYPLEFCVDVTIVGQCLLYLLSIASNIQQVASYNTNFCHTFIVTVFVLIPFTFFGSPRNFRLIGILDALASVVFLIVLIVALFFDKPRIGPVVYSEPTLHSLALSVGYFIFAFGAGPVHPTILIDMYDRRLFPHSVATAYLIVLIFYVPLPMLGYAVYGDGTMINVLDNISQNVDLEAIRKTIKVIYIFQLCTSYIITFNPTFQAFEAIFRAPRKLSYMRCLIRTAWSIVILLLGLGIPYFSQFVEIVGTSTLNLVTYVLPPIFYVCLVVQKDPKFPKRFVSKKEWFMLIQVIVLGIIGVCLATYVTVHKIIDKGVVASACMLNISAARPKYL